MRLITLLENTAGHPGLAAARGLSIYAETAKHRVLFDMGPDAQFLDNANALGVDLAAVDTAVLSHGHSDHGGGIAAFCRVNQQAPLYLRESAFGGYYAVKPGEEPQYIGLDPALESLRARFVPTAERQRLDGELLLFSDVADDPSLRAPAPKLQEKTGQGFRPDGFGHEQHLLIESEGKAVLLAGCAHKGIVSILRAARAHLGRMPDVVMGGFHLFELAPESPESVRLLDATAEALSEGNTVYYTGHCTGEWAFARLRAALGDRLRPMNGGAEVVLP